MMMSCAEVPGNKQDHGESPHSKAPIMPLTAEELKLTSQSAEKAQKVVLMTLWNGQRIPHSEVVLNFFNGSETEPFLSTTWEQLLASQRADEGCMFEAQKAGGLDSVKICGGKIPNPTKVSRIEARDPQSHVTMTAHQLGLSVLSDGSLSMLALFY